MGGSSVLGFIVLLNTWLIMWRVLRELLRECGCRQRELCVFGDHNCFPLFVLYSESAAVSECPQMPAVCQCHLSWVDQGFALTDVYCLKERTLDFLTVN